MLTPSTPNTPTTPSTSSTNAPAAAPRIWGSGSSARHSAPNDQNAARWKRRSLRRWLCHEDANCAAALQTKGTAVSRMAHVDLLGVLAGSMDSMMSGKK
jgi:hypothetical protein